MFITKKHLPRRTFLRGMGATLALPLLDAMVPARTLLAQDRRQPGVRASDSSTCRTARSWTSGRRRPTGAGFEFTPILKPLEPFRDRRERRQRPRHIARPTPRPSTR